MQHTLEEALSTLEHMSAAHNTLADRELQLTNEIESVRFCMSLSYRIHL
jgi:hypothetical protein